jgi:hypothetical protein
MAPLSARTRVARLLAALRGEQSTTDASPAPAPPVRGAGTYADLVRRLEHLEAALEGLQDAVYRQDVVHDRQISDLRNRRPSP